MESAVLAIDCGTSSLKGVLVSQSGKLFAIPHVYVAQIPRAAADTQEWGPREAIGDLAKCLFLAASEASQQKLSISAIALTTTTSSIVCVDMDSRLPLDNPPPMRWDDLQARKEAIGVEKCRRRIGAFPWMAPIGPDTGIAKLCFLLKKYFNELENPSLRIMEQWTFYNWWLTGEYTQSESILSRKWGFTKKDGWPRKFADYLSHHYPSKSSSPGQKYYNWLLKKFLPGKILSAGECIGLLRPALSKITALPRRIPVFTAPFDTCAQDLILCASV